MMFDLKTLKIIGQIKGEDDADSILYDPSFKRVLGFQWRSQVRDRD